MTKRRRVTEGLLPHPSAAELARMYEERTGQKVEPLKLLEMPMFVRQDPRVPTSTAELRDRTTGQLLGRIVDMEDPKPSGGTWIGGEYCARVVAPGVLTAERRGDRLTLTLYLAPRTKKNGGKGGFGGIRQRQAYRDFRTWVVNALAGVTAKLGLPLPERPYNVAATYYVDRGGEQADKCGLDQGLYDALENAGVVTDDWYFRQDDGTRIITGDPVPRVELTITPLEESP